MTLVVIGPVTHDLVVIGDEESHKIGGATYFQSFVFEEFYNDYLAIVNCSDERLIEEFPSKDKVKAIMKENTHFFINKYVGVPKWWRGEFAKLVGRVIGAEVRTLSPTPKKKQQYKTLLIVLYCGFF